MDKLVLIKKILTTASETDRQIMALIEAMEAKAEPLVKGPASLVHKIHIEERACHRKCVALDAAINTGKEKIRARVGDVSATGVFIQTEKNISLGQDIAIRLMTAEGDEFSFISRVVRVEEQGIGVQIKTISSSHQQRLAEFIKKL